MCARAAQVKPANRRAVVPIAEERACGPHLIDPERPMKDVATYQAETLLQVAGRQGGACNDGAAKVGSVLIDGIDDESGSFVPCLIPAAAAWQLGCEMLA